MSLTYLTSSWSDGRDVRFLCSRPKAWEEVPPRGGSFWPPGTREVWRSLQIYGWWWSFLPRFHLVFWGNVTSLPSTECRLRRAGTSIGGMKWKTFSVLKQLHYHFSFSIPSSNCPSISRYAFSQKYHFPAPQTSLRVLPLTFPSGLTFHRAS